MEDWQRVATRILGGAAAIATLLVAPAAGAHKPLVREQMRNARYCEIFTVDLDPSPTATVWNSLGLNRCPQAWWDGLDTGALAAEHGSDLALLNGPRNFIMDRAKAKAYGPVDTFAGKRLRDVATIDLETVGLAPPPPFTDVRITRRNTWAWDAGKKVFELVAPSGRVYIMQSYSRQVDPSLRYSDLPEIGPRLGLPAGWTYRVRRPAEKLVLITNGTATITQDALHDTYQRLPVGLTR
jgi:hypothetical protein